MDANTAWIAFKAEPPVETVPIMNEFSRSFPEVSVEVRPDAAYSEDDLHEALAVAHFSVYEQGDVADASTTFDHEARIASIIVLLDRSTSESRAEDLRSAAIEAIRQSPQRDVLDVIDVAVKEADGPTLSGDDSSTRHHGGEGISACTSGFGTLSTSHTSGTRGISTAGHCGNSQADDGDTLTYQGGYDGSQGDYQWHTGPDIETDDFYAGTSTTTETNLRDVSSGANPVTGQSLCKNGAYGFADCQEVRDDYVCSSENCWLAQMGARQATGGDSGGPVYWGNTAYGLHEGWMYDPFQPFDRDVFSRQSRMVLGIGVYVAYS